MNITFTTISAIITVYGISELFLLSLSIGFKGLTVIFWLDKQVSQKEYMNEYIHVTWIK